MREKYRETGKIFVGFPIVTIFSAGKEYNNGRGNRREGSFLQTEVYADLYFLVNASMDLLCILLTARLLQTKTARWRALLAAGFGGLFSLAILLLGAEGWGEVFLDLAAAFVICLLAFAGKRTGAARLARTTTVFFLVSAILGGVMTALYSLLNRLNLPFDAFRGETISVWMFAILSLVAGILTLRGGRFLGISAKKKRVRVEAILFGRRVTLGALLDTGNLLRDPIGGRSVIVAEKSRLRGVLPPALFLPPGNPAREAWLRDYENAKRVRLLPAKTATGEGVLTAIVPDSLVLTCERESHRATHLVALADLGGKAAGFDALIGEL